MQKKLESVDFGRISLPMKQDGDVLPNTLISGLDRRTFVEHCMMSSNILATEKLDWNLEKFRAKFETSSEGVSVGVTVTLTEGQNGLRYVDISRSSGSALKFMEVREKFRDEFEKLLPDLEATA